MDLYWWLTLSRVPGVGPATVIKLVQRFGSAKAVFRASLKALQEVERVGRQLAEALLAYKDDGWAEKELARTERLGIRLVLFGDASYPPSLAAIPDPPSHLYVKGEFKPEDGLALAIVGSRAASTYGLQTTNRIARDLARRGVTVVSGMARGIDSEAHKGALAGGGRTIAVLGSGLNVIYPPENRELYSRIAERGAVVSEYPLDAEPDAVHFPSRNRIISGLSLGVTIVEAAPKSGSLITAQLALEQGREVFAVPGSVDSMRSRGTHQLIRQGAHLVETAEDIFTEMKALVRAWGRGAQRVEAPAEPPEPLSQEEERVLALLGEEPLHIDLLTQRGVLSPSAAASALLQLELKGRARQLPGKRFVRVES
jgi:DNA processing protein